MVGDGLGLGDPLETELIMMNRHSISVSDIVDEAAPVVRRNGAPWLGVLWATAIPLRISQAYFYNELYLLSDPTRFGDYLGRLALYAFAALLPALWGRAVFVRACTLSMQSGRRTGAEALRPPAAPLANFICLALLFEMLFYMFAFTWIAIPFLVILSGLAAVTPWQTERPGLIRPLRDLFSFTGNLSMLFALLMIFTMAMFIVYINFYLALRGVVWSGGSLLGQDLSRWEYLLRGYDVGGGTEIPFWPAEGLVRWICLAGTVLIVEPFWFASLNVYVHRSRFTESGEDLHRWLQKLKSEA